MSPEERSRLMYLVDALEAAPDKFAPLLKLAATSDATEAYKSAIERLEGAGPEHVREVTSDLRFELT
jgi:hypothetical protein